MLYFDVPALVTDAEVAELADALASGASGGNPMKVRVLSSAPAFAHCVSYGWHARLKVVLRSAKRNSERDRSGDRLRAFPQRKHALDERGAPVTGLPAKSHVERHGAAHGVGAVHREC